MIKSKIIVLLCLISVLRVFYIINTEKTMHLENEKVLKGKIVDIEKQKDKTVFVIKKKYKYKITTYSKFNYDLGDIVLIKAKVFLPTNNTVFNLFNYRKYLLSRNIIALGELKEIKLISKNKNVFYSIKNILCKHIENYKSKDYLKTFILGKQSGIEENIKESYRSLGISHLFSVSGMHINLFVLVLSKMSKRYKNRQIFIMLFLLFYLFLTNFAVSLLRCFLFFIAKYFNEQLRINLNNLQILIIITCFILLVNPYLIYNVGFLFSVVITFFILLYTNKKIIDNYIVSLFKISLIAFLSSIPIISFSFFKINILSVFYNIIFVPIVSFVIFPLSLILFFAPFLDNVFYMILSCFNDFIIFFDNLNIFEFAISKTNFIYVILYYLILFLYIKVNKKIIIFYIVLLVINLNSNFFIIYPTVTFLDVGQGDSYIITLSKGKNILIDTGGTFNSSTVLNRTIPYMWSTGINKIDALILSHGDYDHMGEAINLVNNFKVEKVIFNCGEFNELEQNLIKELDKKKIPYYSCIKELNIDDNKLYFMNNKDYSNENDNSSVIYTELNNHKFLFMGDAGVEVEKDLIEKYNLKDVDVLKVGHHGSKTSSSKEFIDDINPKYSVISVGKNNRYGHPNDSVLDNLNDSQIYRTDKDGSVMFKIKDSKLEIEACSP